MTTYSLRSRMLLAGALLGVACLDAPYVAAMPDFCRPSPWRAKLRRTHLHVAKARRLARKRRNVRARSSKRRSAA